MRKGTSHASVTLLSHNRFRGDERTVGTIRPRLGTGWLVGAAAAVAGARATPALPAAAAPVAPHHASPAASVAAAACGVAGPHSGKILLSRMRGGQGRLTLKTHLSHDSVIVLVQGR